MKGVSVTIWFLAAACGGGIDARRPTAVEPTTASAASASASSSPENASTAEASSRSPTPSSPPIPTAAAKEATPLPKSTAVLHVGDSFVHSGLTQRLRTHFDALGVRYEVHAEKSTNSLDWAKRVPALVSATQPDLVLITLGGNEIGSVHLDVQARAIKKIVSSIGDRPCVWMTPPLWREELGLFDTLTANIAPCRVFETDAQIKRFIPRREDKIHPTVEGGALWADGLYAWLMRERVGDPKPWSLSPGDPNEATPKGHRFPLTP
jgi:hypothetical protein